MAWSWTENGLMKVMMLTIWSGERNFGDGEMIPQRDDV